jgi:hypothetical protein
MLNSGFWFPQLPFFYPSSWLILYSEYGVPPKICEECVTQEECLAYGCYWYDGSCHTLPPPISGYIGTTMGRTLGLNRYDVPANKWIYPDGKKSSNYGFVMGFWVWKQSLKKWTKGGVAVEGE